MQTIQEPEPEDIPILVGEEIRHFKNTLEAYVFAKPLPETIISRKEAVIQFIGSITGTNGLPKFMENQTPHDDDVPYITAINQALSGLAAEINRNVSHSTQAGVSCANEVMCGILSELSNGLTNNALTEVAQLRGCSAHR